MKKRELRLSLLLCGFGPQQVTGRKFGNLVFRRFLSRAVSAQLRGLGRFRLCETRPRASLRRSALRRASETDYAQKPETQTILSDCSPAPAAGQERSLNLSKGLFGRHPSGSCRPTHPHAVAPLIRDRNSWESRRSLRSVMSLFGRHPSGRDSHLHCFLQTALKNKGKCN